MGLLESVYTTAPLPGKIEPLELELVGFDPTI